MRRHWSMVYLVAAVILTFVIGLLGGLALPLRWLLTMGVFLALLALIGRDVTGHEAEPATRRGRARAARFVPGRLDGVLIDMRHKVSLARLQLVLWTVVVLSAWVTLALHRTIPIIQGRVLTSNAALVEEVAGLLARTDAPAGAVAVTPDEGHVERAAAVLGQLTGADMTAPDATETLPVYSPLDIAFPQEIWLALGISIASLAGASVIKSNQATNEDGRAVEIVETRLERAEAAVAGAGQEVAALESMRSDALEALTSGPESLDPDSPEMIEARQQVQAELDALSARVQTAEANAAKAEARVAELQAVQAEAVGELHAKRTFEDARWSDMLRGDTIANFQFADLGKIQMFFFTVILVFAYAALVWSIMSMPAAEGVLQLAPALTLPAFSDSVVLTLALSHGGYLATKTAA